MSEFEELREIQDEEEILLIKKIEKLNNELKSTHRKTFFGAFVTTICLLTTLYFQSNMFKHYPILLSEDQLKFYFSSASGLATLLGIFITNREISKETVIDNQLEQLEEQKDRLLRG